MKRFLLSCIVVFFVIAGLFVITGVITHAEGQGADDPSVLAKLDEVLSGQKAIMADIAAMKEELRIIKIRITQQQ